MQQPVSLGGVCGCTLSAGTGLPSYISFMYVCVGTRACLRKDVLICQRGRQSVLCATGLNSFVWVCLRVCVGGSRQVSACEGVGGEVWEQMLENRLTCIVCLGLCLDDRAWILYLCFYVLFVVYLYQIICVHVLFVTLGLKQESNSDIINLILISFKFKAEMSTATLLLSSRFPCCTHNPLQSPQVPSGWYYTPLRVNLCGWMYLSL